MWAQQSSSCNMIHRKTRNVGGFETEYGYVGSQPTTRQMARNVKFATQRVVSAMMAHKPVFVDEKVYAARMAICERCEYWSGNARLGLGKCTHSSCGCTRLKQKIATESCPVGRWNRVDNWNDSK